MRDVTFSEGQIAMVTKVVYGVEDGPAELHFLVRPTSAVLGVVVGVDASKRAGLREIFNQA